MPGGGIRQSRRRRQAVQWPRRPGTLPAKEWAVQRLWRRRLRPKRMEAGAAHESAHGISCHVRGNFSGKSSGVVEGLGLNMNRDGSLQMIEIRQNDEHLMSAVVGITPTIAN